MRNSIRRPRRTNTARKVIIFGLLAFVAVVALSFPLWSPYFIDEEVNEEFPFALSEAQQQSFEQLPAAQQDALVEMNASNPEEAAQIAQSITQPDTVMQETLPEDTTTQAAAPEVAAPEVAAPQPIVLSVGSFIELDPIHGATGSATIYQLGDERVLRFEDFRSTNGPDLHVLLATGSDPRSRGDLGDYIDLGELKGNVGNQNYIIPPEVDLSQYNSVVIYCLPFHVVFSNATLSADGA